MNEILWTVEGWRFDEGGGGGGGGTNKYMHMKRQIGQKLTHLPQVSHRCVSELGHRGFGNGLSSVRHQAITWTNAGALSIGFLGINFSEIRIGILLCSFKKIYLKISAANMATILSWGDELKGTTSTINLIPSGPMLMMKGKIWPLIYSSWPSI